MTTIINNPDGNNSGISAFIGIILAILLLFIIIRWGIPAIRGEDRNNTTVEVQLPLSTTPEAE